MPACLECGAPSAYLAQEHHTNKPPEDVMICPRCGAVVPVKVLQETEA